MEKGPESDAQPTVAAVLAEMHGILAEIKATGAVDTEPETLRYLQQQLISGMLTPADALAQARTLAGQRQNYH